MSIALLMMNVIALPFIIISNKFHKCVIIGKQMEGSYLFNKHVSQVIVNFVTIVVSNTREIYINQKFMIVKLSVYKY